MKIKVETRKELFGWLRDAAIAVVIVIILLQFYVPKKAVGLSMFPALQSGDRVFFRKLSHTGKSLQRGEIVYFTPPYGEGDHFVKRIVGLPGETVEVYDGSVVINGIPLKEPYAFFNPEVPRERRWWDEYHIKLGDSEYFVMGDNRDASTDSRYFGPVNGKNIHGKLAIFYWPPAKFLKKPSQSLR